MEYMNISFLEWMKITELYVLELLGLHCVQVNLGVQLLPENQRTEHWKMSQVSPWISSHVNFHSKPECNRPFRIDFAYVGIVKDDQLPRSPTVLISLRDRCRTSPFNWLYVRRLPLIFLNSWEIPYFPSIKKAKKVSCIVHEKET